MRLLPPPCTPQQLHFDTKEDAIGFAARNGWAYEVLRETSKSNRAPGFTSYKDNFLDKRVSAELIFREYLCVLLYSGQILFLGSPVTLLLPGSCWR